MEITWDGDEGFWGSIHVATCFYDGFRPKGEKSVWKAGILLPARKNKKWVIKYFDTQEMGRRYCKRLCKSWIKETGLNAD